jgi:glycolate oxidase iron-sulfur subunit
VQTRLSSEQLARPGVAQVESILRTCVHCGFCNATCPTYALFGDELDGPRGRIYQVKSWLEENRPPSASDAKHIDRCLSCLACVTTCPSGVDYMHLVDYARAEIEASPARSRGERVLRAALGRVLSDARLFRHALRLGRLFRPLARFAPARLRALFQLLPEHAPGRGGDAAQPHAPITLRNPSQPRRRVALVRGCVQDALRPQINDAALRVLVRFGCEVHEVSSAHCCGALVHHLGQARRAHATAAATAGALHELIVERGVDTIVSSASGCGTMLKDYGQLLGDSDDTRTLGADIAARTRDLAELIGELGGVAQLLESGGGAGSAALCVAVHSPCSIHHGQRLGDRLSPLLTAAGYATSSLPDPHMCCGSAGVYNILQPQIARELRARKADLIRASGAQVVATANIGCLTQLRAGLREAGVGTPVVHAIELLDAAMATQKSE